MAKSKVKQVASGRPVAQFLIGKRLVHEIVADRSSTGGYSVRLGPGHYMAIPQSSVEEIMEYGRSRGFTAVAL